MDDRVRIDVTEAAGFAETDTEAIAQALEDYLSDDEVKVIQIDGPVLMEQGPPDGLGRLGANLEISPGIEASVSTRGADLSAHQPIG